jgi:DNA-binding NarL/FixJ family response regulator
VLSGEEDPRQVRRAIDAGAAGFIPKSSTPEVLLSALRLVLADGVYLPAVALKGIAAGGTEAPVSADRIGDSLSERQIDVLRKAVQGKANKVIARELSISEGTVKAHLSAAFRALGVHNRTEAVYAAARSGLQLKP